MQFPEGLENTPFNRAFHCFQPPWRLLESAIQNPIEKFAIMGHNEKKTGLKYKKQGLNTCCCRV